MLQKEFFLPSSARAAEMCLPRLIHGATFRQLRVFPRPIAARRRRKKCGRRDATALQGEAGRGFEKY